MLLPHEKAEIRMDKAALTFRKIDIVGRNKANPGSMRSAIQMAIDMAVKRHARQEADRARTP